MKNLLKTRKKQNIKYWSDEPKITSFTPGEPKETPHKPPLGIPQSKERPRKQIYGNGTGVVGKLFNGTLNAADFPEQ